MTISTRDQTVVPLREVLMLRREPVKVDLAATYPNLGIYSFGRGLFAKSPISGASTSASTLYRVRAGQFVYSRLFAFEGAFGVVPPHMDGWYVSNEYPTFDIDDSRASVEFLRLAICRPSIWEELAGMTVGMGHRRQRLRPDDLLSLDIELPSLGDQQAVVELSTAAARAVEAAREEVATVLQAMRATAEARVTCADAESSALDELLVGLRTGDSPRCEPRPAAAGEWGVLKLSAIRPGLFDPTATKALPPGTAHSAESTLHGGEVLMTRSNTLRRVGACCRVPRNVRDRLIYPDLVFRLVLDADRVDPDYVVAALGLSTSRIQIEDAATGTSDSMKKISAAVIRQIEIPLPPIASQRRIAAVLESFRQTWIQTQSTADAAERLRSALVEGLLSGERRIRI